MASPKQINIYKTHILQWFPPWVFQLLGFRRDLWKQEIWESWCHLFVPFMHSFLPHWASQWVDSPDGIMGSQICHFLSVEPSACVIISSNLDYYPARNQTYWIKTKWLDLLFRDNCSFCFWLYSAWQNIFFFFFFLIFGWVGSSLLREGFLWLQQGLLFIAVRGFLRL